MGRQIGERQRWAWLLCGASVCVAACACGMGWLWVLLGALVAAMYYIYLDLRLRPCGLAALLPAAFGGVGKVLAALNLLWLVILMGWAANMADAAFPMVDGYPMLGWVMLAMAAWGSRKGPGACAACVGVLSLFLLVLYGAISAFAAPDIRLQSLQPDGGWEAGLRTLCLLLMPAGVWYLPCRKGKQKPAWLPAVLLPLGAGVLAVITVGVLTPELAAKLPAPLYTVAQSVSILGVMERIEPLLSAAMIMGVFGLLSGMACACQALGDQLRRWKWTGTAACAAAGVIMGAAETLRLPLLASGTVVFWIVIPVMALCGQGKEKPRNCGQNRK